MDLLAIEVIEAASALIEVVVYVPLAVIAIVGLIKLYFAFKAVGRI